jgi:cytochrome c biogenesis protein CcdA
MMLRRVGVALTVGLADSLNPTTVGPALFLATGAKRVVRVTQFTVGVFVVTLTGGIVLTIGPGRLLLDLVPRPQGTVRHIIELVAGILLLAVAAGLWSGRRGLARRELPGRRGGSGSAFVAGASIAAFELPTAAPYFAVIAATAAANSSVAEKIAMLTLYNVAFVLPLLAIIGVLLFGGEHADHWLTAGGEWLQRRWPVVLASLLLVVGGLLAVLGGVGLLKQ